MVGERFLQNNLTWKLQKPLGVAKTNSVLSKYHETIFNIFITSHLLEQIC